MSTGTDDVMRQVAPYPRELDELVRALRYRRDRGWEVYLDPDCVRDRAGVHSGESRGLTLVIVREGPDSYHPERSARVAHYFAVPPSTFNRQSWMMWLFERLRDVDDHERMEDFAFTEPHEVALPSTVGPGDVAEVLTRPYAPNHGPGWSPYLITIERTGLDRRTAFTGRVNPA